MTRTTLIIFARAPAIGVGKTRLARDVGRVEAWRVYRAMSGGLVRRLGRDPRWRTVVRIAPDRVRWPGARSEPQGRGGLGERLERAVRAHARGPVAVIGTDAPDVDPERVGRAFRALRGGGLVVGPAEDGGFWLLALSPRRARTVSFPGVRWSTAETLANTLAALGGEAVLLETLADVDDGEALRAWRRRSVQARVHRARPGGHGVQRG
jgi:glycosyltransferase A (GT-A) superfamily protein (DUF2064 family)